MNPPETDTQLTAEVRRIKADAVNHQARVRRILGILLTAGIVVGVLVWFLQKPIDRDDVQAGAALGLGLATFVVGALLFRILYPRPKAQCPQCGCDWNVESENDEDRWLTWEFCPRCGLQMSGGTVSPENH